MTRPNYLIDCDKCGAKALKSCVTKSGRKTDTHAIRIANQFTTPDFRTAIRRVLYDIYGSFVAEVCTERIAQQWLVKGWSHVGDDDQDELMLYIWMNSSGGGTAEIAAKRIRLAVDNWYRTK